MDSVMKYKGVVPGKNAMWSLQRRKEAKVWVTLERISWLGTELCEVSAKVAGYEVRGRLGMSSGPTFPEATPSHGGHPVFWDLVIYLWVP